MSRPSIALVALLAGVTIPLSACSASSEAETTLTVAAAASLTDVFTDIGAAFTQRNPQVAVTFSFAGSSTIAQQLREGAPIDVFASAGSNAMTPVVNDGLVGAVNDFTTNSLQIATPPDNPGQVTRLADLENVSVLVCATQVPCGAAAAMLFERNALTVSPVSFESDVRAVLTKIADTMTMMPMAMYW